MSRQLFDIFDDLGLEKVLARKENHLLIDEALGTPLLFAYLYKKKKDKYAIVASNLYSAQRIYESLLSFLKEDEVIFFPSDELLRAETVSSSKELMAQRLYALEQMKDNKPKILICHPSSLMRFLPNPKTFFASIIEVKKGMQIPREFLKTALVSLGYNRVNKIDQSLQFALRGDILDIFPISSSRPIRIEFFDDEVESIRTFDIATQSSVSELDGFSILPATDMTLSDEELASFKVKIEKVMEQDSASLTSAQKESYLASVNSDVEKILERNYQSSLYRYFGFAVNHSYSVLSYFNPKCVFIADEKKLNETAPLLQKEARKFYDELRENQLLPSHMEQYMSLESALEGHKVVYGSVFADQDAVETFAAWLIISEGHGFSSFIPTVHYYLSQGEKVVICLNEPRQKDAITKALQEASLEYEEVKGLIIPDGDIAISLHPLRKGFEIRSAKIAYISSDEAFGIRAGARYSSRYKNATILKHYEELKPGDYVVHENYGIGQFQEIATREVDGTKRDYLLIAYAGSDRLLVPLEQFRLVRKYAGREGASPKLSSLYGNEWKKRKAKIYERINDLADRLIALYGSRLEEKGYAFPSDDDMQLEFENAFPYELTPDQEIAIRDIKADMEKPEIMDRIVVGDVGFGKTELAFRAAFKAITGGKQVAMLCPTTILARQHYELAKERFNSFGANVALVSRLVSDKEQDEIIEGLKEGRIDFVIGTHRLLSQSIKYKDLGLLIVDEEQRFGVEQKEKIKELKTSVDVLTLSATPIPRTLQMSLVGIRKMSQINTPPKNRSPIQTYVIPYKPETIDELISRELARSGQVFYLKNDTGLVHMRAMDLEKRIPGSSVGVVHGRMDKERIERVMEKFYNGKINILVCTSIIENGIDVPNANMVVVEDADRFGLSQLYQIKGRVGRSDRIAYAYLTYNPHKMLNEDATKRLQAIQEFTELGSGYHIAQRDLLIRGAGDMLGPEQAGFIDSIGLDLYLKMLNEAISRKEKGAEEEATPIKSSFMLSAYIPKEYVDDSDKLEVYQALDAVKSEQELEDFKAHLRDVYGRLPKEIGPLIEIKKINLLLADEEFEKATEYKDYFDLQLSAKFSSLSGIGLDLFTELDPYLNFVHVSFLNKEVHIKIDKGEGWMERLREIIGVITALYKKRNSQ